MAYKLHIRILQWTTWAIVKSEMQAKDYAENLIAHRMGLHHIDIVDLETNTMIFEWDKKEWDEDWNHNER